MQRFSAKRHVVRQALADLENIGIIVRSPNRGATVRDFTAQEVEEICELREILQHRAAQRIPLPAAPQLLPSCSRSSAGTIKPSPRAIRGRSIMPMKNFITRCLPLAGARIFCRRSSITPI